MPADTGLAQLSNGLLLAALVTYSLAVLAFAGDFAYGRRPGRTPASGAREQELALAAVSMAAARDPAAGRPAAVGLAAGAVTGDRPAADPPKTRLRTPAAQLAAAQPGAARRAAPAGPWLRGALALSGTGLVSHVAAVLARGLAVHRVPWGDMYEFVTALTCVAVMFFLAVMIRYRAWSLGLFVMGAVVFVLGLARTAIYTPAGPLVPALQSYWLAIHVTAVTLATGIFFVAAVMGVMYLAAGRHARRVAAGGSDGAGGIMRRLPSPGVLDRLAYRTVVFAFPIWTFGIMAGAIWADEAWGRYWGWDPTETWAFITWVVYACFLHARATAGWRGRRAAVIQLAGFGCLLFNVTVVSLFINGLHSYAGLT